MACLRSQRVEVSRNSVAVRIEREVSGRQVVSYVAQGRRIDGTDAEHVQRLEQHAIQVADCPWVSNHRRHRKQNRLRSGRIWRIILKRNTARLDASRDELGPLIGDETTELAVE